MSKVNTILILLLSRAFRNIGANIMLVRRAVLSKSNFGPNKGPRFYALSLACVGAGEAGLGAVSASWRPVYVAC